MDAVQLDCDVASTTWQSWHQILWPGAHQVVCEVSDTHRESSRNE